ncbi:MAG: leucine-rich repeat domain-containing protein [Eubacterium sp.]|nr:leucine-rich repeat domain-containing protein [Eubacterium sp.]
MKKSISIILSVLMLLSVITPFTAFADAEIKTKVVDNVRYKYTVTDKEATLTHMEALGDQTKITIPSKLGGYPVRVLAHDCFATFPESEPEQVSPKVKTVVIPDSVKTINSGAFEMCRSIQTFIIGKGVTKISRDAFYWCTGLKKFVVSKENKKYSSPHGNLCNKSNTVLIKYPGAKTKEDITLDRTIKKIKENAFRPNTHLKSINFNNVEVVESDAVDMCNALETMKFGKRMKDFHPGNYFYNTKLKSIEVPKKNKYYSSRGGVLYNKNKTKLIYYPNAKKGTKFTIPETVTTIGKFALYCNSKLKTIVFPKGLKTIGRLSCFQMTNVETIDLKNTKVTKICDHAFAYCYKLTELKLPKTLETIGENAFANHKIKNVVIPKNVESIKKYAFSSYSMETIKIYGDNTKITKSSFLKHDSTGYIATIIAHKGSKAHELAEKYNIPFEELK